MKSNLYVFCCLDICLHLASPTFSISYVPNLTSNTACPAVKKQTPPVPFCTLLAATTSISDMDATLKPDKSIMSSKVAPKKVTKEKKTKYCVTKSSLSQQWCLLRHYLFL